MSAHRELEYFLSHRPIKANNVSSFSRVGKVQSTALMLPGRKRKTLGMPLR